MRELIYFSTRLVDEHWMIREGGRLRRRVGLARLVSVKPRVSVGLPAVQLSVEPSVSRHPGDLQLRYDQLRRSLKRRLLTFPSDHIPRAGRPPAIEFEVDARWGLMPFLGLGFTPNYAEIEGKRALRLWTFWLEGHAADGSVLVLVGSADNLLSVDPAAFSSHELRPGFNYPSSTDGLTALVLATNPSMKTSMPDEEWGWMNLRDVDVTAFALSAPRRCDNDEGLDLQPEPDELPTWERGRGRVRGLARVYASATGREIKARHAQHKWLADDAHVVIAAPYVVAHV